MPDSRRIPLLYACRYGHKDIVEFLIDHGSSPLTADEHGQTPLLIATWNGHTGIAQLLFALGGKEQAIHHTLDSGQSAMLIAAKQGNTTLVDLFASSAEKGTKSMIF